MEHHHTRPETGNRGLKTAAGSRKLWAAKLSILVNSFFIILKVGIGLLSGSIGIIAESLHSFLDLIASVFAYFGLKKGDEPFDKSHPYGHEKFENLSSIIQMMLIAITALVILYEALEKLASPGVEFEELGIILMLMTTAISYKFSKYLHGISEEEHSHALEADAYHFTSDVWGSVAVMGGLVLSRLGFPMADPIAAIVVALIMLRLAYTTGMKMLNILLEHSAEEHVLHELESIIKSDSNVVRFHKLRARYIGARIWVDVHIHIRKNLSLKEAHRIAHRLKDRIMRKMRNVKEVNIHLEPD